MAEDTYGLGGPVKGGREVAPLKILVFAYFTLAFSNGQNRIPDLESSEDFGLCLLYTCLFEWTKQNSGS